MDRKKWAINIFVVASWFLSYFVIKTLPFDIGVIGSLIFLSAYLMILFIHSRSGFLRIRVDKYALYSLILGLVFILVLLEPVFLGRPSFHPSFDLFNIYVIIYGLVYATFIQSFIFNLNSSSLIRRGDPRAINAPFLLFVSLFFQLNIIILLPSASPASILSFTLALLSNIVLFYFLYILFIKSKFNNLAGILFYAITTVPTVLGITYHASPLLSSLWIFVDYGILFIVIEILTKDNVYTRKIFSINPRAFRRTGRGTVEAIVVAALLVSLVFVIAPLAYNTPHPFLTDPTGSMYPIIKPGSLLVVKGVSVDTIQIGQILVFTAPWDINLTVAHMVIKIFHRGQELYFQTKGVANSLQDPAPVPASDVRGIVITIIPYLGYLFLYSYAIISIVLIITVVMMTVKFK